MMNSLLGALVVSIVGFTITAAHNDNVMDSTTLAACEFPAIYNFGDSNSDTGGMAAAFYPMGEPCGESYFHRPAGRGCDGRLIIDFIAEHLGVPHLSPYLDTLGTSYRHGANFATGGATIRRINESWFVTGVSPFPLDIQVEHFTQFKERTTYFYNQAKETSDKSRLAIPEEFPKALYTMDIGQNDIAAAFRMLPNMEQIRATIPGIINQFAAQVRDLYKKEARNFWIHNTGPIGCLPVATVKVKDPAPGYLDEQGCVKDQNDIALEFNKQLSNMVIKLRIELQESAITYVDLYRAKYELISNAKNQGFEEASKICCGYHENGNDIWCGKKERINNGTEIYTGSCDDPSTVISWDGVHYTEAANHWIANYIMNGYLSNPPHPITKACHPLH
ncbi:GDSL esterase/lipase At5g14450-like [Lycium ferocissimum]|uniref:GDSL esterase/lipase At5g14450-like n=1 Tax=Lycium ferocissimum TaxID=112874 RepID=UPI002816573B|nr:GDSL esterase/lipase At5g14450-like [Lycium ferocissimum]